MAPGALFIPGNFASSLFIFFFSTLIGILLAAAFLPSYSRHLCFLDPFPWVYSRLQRFAFSVVTTLVWSLRQKSGSCRRLLFRCWGILLVDLNSCATMVFGSKKKGGTPLRLNRAFSDRQLSVNQVMLFSFFLVKPPLPKNARSRPSWRQES